MKKVIVTIIFLLAFFVLSFLFDALIIKGICWAFGLAFNWKLAFGIWLIIVSLCLMFRSFSKGR